jgi:hypothetical protein
MRLVMETLGHADFRLKRLREAFRTRAGFRRDVRRGAMDDPATTGLRP